MNTYGTIFDESVTQLSHFVPGHGDLLQKEFPSLFHHLLAAGQVLTGSEAGETEISLYSTFFRNTCCKVRAKIGLGTISSKNVSARASNIGLIALNAKKEKWNGHL